jgi:hypothetical protein
MLAKLLQTFALLAAFTDSPDSVTIETPQLAQMSDLHSEMTSQHWHAPPCLLSTYKC